jgi:isopentenyldiphosphate isomerase
VSASGVSLMSQRVLLPPQEVVTMSMQHFLAKASMHVGVGLSLILALTVLVFKAEKELLLSIRGMRSVKNQTKTLQNPLNK